MLIKKKDIFDYLESMTGDKCYIGLHGIADKSDIQNEYSNLSKEEKAKNMLKIGIINARGGSMRNTALFFGNLSAPNDFRNVETINNYSFNSFQSNSEVIMVLAIPILFQTSNGNTFFGGWIDGDSTDSQYIPQSISDYSIPQGNFGVKGYRKIIPPEFIFGYFSHTKSDVEAEMTLNPRFYYNLSKEERDTFISSFIQEQYAIDLSQTEYSTEEQVSASALPKHLKQKTLLQIEEYLSPEYQKRIEEREKQKNVIPYTLEEINSLPIDEIDLSKVVMNQNIILHSKYSTQLKAILIRESVDAKYRKISLSEAVGIDAGGTFSIPELVVKKFEDGMLKVRSDVDFESFYSEWYSAFKYQFNELMLKEISQMKELAIYIKKKNNPQGNSGTEKNKEIYELMQKDSILDEKLKEARRLERAYNSQAQIDNENPKKDVDAYGE